MFSRASVVVSHIHRPNSSSDVVSASVFCPRAISAVRSVKRPARPGAAAQQPQGGWDEQPPDECGVDEDDGGEGEAEFLKFKLASEQEAGENDDHDGRGGEDDGSASPQAHDDGGGRVAAVV